MTPASESPAATAEVTSAVRRRYPRWLKFVRSVVVIYLGVCVGMYFLQDFMLFPGRSTQGRKQAVVRESGGGGYELVRLTTRGGDRIVALFGEALAPDGRRRIVTPDPSTQAGERGAAERPPTMIFFYGNAMCLADAYGEFMRFRSLGVNVIVPEYVGYGMSSGRPSEQALYDTADAVYDFLLTRAGEGPGAVVDRDRIVASGWSLGAAVAIDLAHRRPVRAVATFSAFTSLRDMARRVAPWLPTSLMLSYRFDNIGKIAELKVPVFLAHGKHDRVIPFSMLDQLVAAAQRGSPSVTRVPLNSDHNDVFEVPRPELLDPLQGFLLPPAK